ncbi:sarcolemmal membrane-associated protein-like [Oppia nitens]|uniref:sarcolemmal membrane-associated protein-like n=1 Tax=Oppia nitens TaxID=1686743 RepID=UPI0023DCDCCF|nr:sarcolemmal membrane-associated protein-like [Oppia nitens]
MLINGNEDSPADRSAPEQHINGTNIEDNMMAAITDGLNAGQTGQSTNASSAQVLLICRKNSHPFTERKVYLEGSTPVKVGRAVARSKPSNDNFVFDCKVLSRNHASLWVDNHKFYLKDTRSSNGTFVNNFRLSPANEESQPREVFSGDIVQFGVDVMENQRKVTHGCIIATLKLYHNDGTEAKCQEQHQNYTTNSNYSTVHISSQQLHELSQYLTEALHREQILENKLETLERVVSSAHESANTAWKSLVEEDRLLSRIETLQNKLEICLNSSQMSNQSNKESTDSTDSSSVQVLREEMLKLIDDKDKYESAAKEAIQKTLEEKLIILTRLHEYEVSIRSHEEECNRLQGVVTVSAKEINRLANCNDELTKEIESYVNRLKTTEDQKISLLEVTNKEREDLEDLVAKLKTKETENNEIIKELRAVSDSANLELEKLKLQLDVIKQTQNVANDGICVNNNVCNETIDRTNDNNNAINGNEMLSEELQKVKKQLMQSNTKCVELNAELNGLKAKHLSGSREMICDKLSDSTVTLKQSTTAMDLPVTDQNYINNLMVNGEINSTNDITINETLINEEIDYCVKSEEKDMKTLDDQVLGTASQQTSSQPLKSEIDLLKELLAETRASKKSTDEELSRTVTELENLRSLTKQLSIESDETQEKIEKTLKEIDERNAFIQTLKNQINDLQEKSKQSIQEYKQLMIKMSDSERLLGLKDDELSSLRVLLEEERKVQQRYANNYEICKKQLCEQQLIAKNSQTEAELLRRKVYSCNEELRTSRNNLSTSSTIDDKTVKENEKLQNECQTLKTKLQTIDTQLYSSRTDHQKLRDDYEYLQKSFLLLQEINGELENRGDNYWKEQYNDAKQQLQTIDSKLTLANKELEELKQECEEYTNNNKALNEDLINANQEIDNISYQNKIATACAIIPLIMLLIAVVMAYYPSVSSVTGTNEL